MPAGYLRVAIENVPGNEINTPTLSTKKIFPPIRSFAPKYGAAPMSRDDEARGQDEPVPVISDNYDPSWDLDCRGYPDFLGIMLKLICGAPVSTVGDGIITDPDLVVIPTGATRHVWTAPFGPSGASPLTAQFDAAYKDQTVFLKQKGAACAELNIESPQEGGVGITASGPANYYPGPVADPGLSPTYEALSIRPFQRGGLTLPTWVSGSGTHEDFSLKIENPVENSHSMGIASKWPDVMEKSNEGPIVVSGSLTQRQLDVDDLNALVTSTGFPAKALWVSDSIIAAAYPYKLFVQFSNAQYVDGDAEDLGNKRRHGATFDFRSTTPSTGSTVLTLVNASASYL